MRGNGRAGERDSPLTPPGVALRSAGMHKPILALAAVGVAGFALWKLAAVLLLPLVGTLLGFVFTILKVAAIAALIWLAFKFITRKKDEGGEPAA